LSPHLPADAAGRHAVVGRADFDAAVEVHLARSELIDAEGLDGQFDERRLLFGKHGAHLALGGAVDARVGPAVLPPIEVGLCLFETLEAQAFQRRILGVADAALHFALSIRFSTRQGRATML